MRLEDSLLMTVSIYHEKAMNAKNSERRPTPGLE